MKKIYKKYELDKSVKNSPNCQHIHTIAANSLLYSATSVIQLKLQKPFPILLKIQIETVVRTVKKGGGARIYI